MEGIIVWAGHNRAKLRANYDEIGPDCRLLWHPMPRTADISKLNLTDRKIIAFVKIIAKAPK